MRLNKTIKMYNMYKSQFTGELAILKLDMYLVLLVYRTRYVFSGGWEGTLIQ